MKLISEPLLVPPDSMLALRLAILFADTRLHAIQLVRAYTSLADRGSSHNWSVEIEGCTQYLSSDSRRILGVMLAAYWQQLMNARYEFFGTTTAEHWGTTPLRVYCDGLVRMSLTGRDNQEFTVYMRWKPNPHEIDPRTD